MASSTTHAPVLLPSIAVILLLLACSHGAVASTITFTCNATFYSDDDPFAVSVATVLQELSTDTPKASVPDIYRSSTYLGATAYGHASCSPAHTRSGCEACLNYIVEQTATVCVHSIGARAVDEDNCNVRFQNYDFRD